MTSYIDVARRETAFLIGGDQISADSTSGADLSGPGLPRRTFGCWLASGRCQRWSLFGFRVAQICVIRLAALLDVLGLAEADLDERYAPTESFAVNWRPILVLADREVFNQFWFAPAAASISAYSRALGCAQLGVDVVIYQGKHVGRLGMPTVHLPAPDGIIVRGGARPIKEIPTATATASS